MPNSLIDVITTLEKFKENKIYNENYIPNFEKMSAIDVLLLPFIHYFREYNHFRDRFINEFYKKYLNRNNFTYISNNLYNNILIGLINLFDEKDLPRDFYDDDCKDNDSRLIRVHKIDKYNINLQQLFIKNIGNENIFYNLKFHIKNKNKFRLQDLGEIDYINFLQNSYPQMYQYLNDIYTDFNPEKDKMLYYITLHFVLVNTLLEDHNMQLVDYITCYKDDYDNNDDYDEMDDDYDDDYDNSKKGKYVNLVKSQQNQKRREQQQQQQQQEQQEESCASCTLPSGSNSIQTNKQQQQQQQYKRKYYDFHHNDINPYKKFRQTYDILCTDRTN